MNLEERAKQIFAKGNYSIKEAFELAQKEASGELPKGFADLFSFLRGNK